jgi:hypothetical protein
MRCPLSWALVGQRFSGAPAPTLSHLCRGFNEPPARNASYGIPGLKRHAKVFGRRRPCSAEGLLDNWMGEAKQLDELVEGMSREDDRVIF